MLSLMGAEDGEKERETSECDARSERYTGNDCKDENSKSDNTSDKKLKAITKDQYGVVWVVGCI